MHPEARTIIGVVQPYHEPTADRVARHPLETLHALDISDKHRVLTVTLGALAGNITGGLPFGASLEGAPWQAFVDGALVNRVRLPAGDDSVPSLTCVPSFDAVLVDAPWATANVIYVLERLLLNWLSEYVVEPLLPFTRQPPPGG